MAAINAVAIHVLALSAPLACTWRVTPSQMRLNMTEDLEEIHENNSVSERAHSFAQTATTIKIAAATPKDAWKACMEGQPFQCRTYSVPLDYSSPDGEKIDVTIAATKKGPESKGVVWNLAGGPGQVAIPIMLGAQQMLKTTVDGFDDYTMDLRGTGQSSALDCSEVREANNWPSKENWNKFCGLGNIGAGLLQKCKRDIAEKKGKNYINFFNSENAARDLAAVMLSLKEEEKTAMWSNQAILARSFGSYWASRFIELQSRDEFPVLVERVELDAAFGPTYSYSRYALAANEAGKVLMGKYCTGQCKEHTKQDGNGWAWLKKTIHFIDQHASEGNGRPECVGYLADWKNNAKKLGWTAGESWKEALGAMAWLAAEHGRGIPPIEGIAMMAFVKAMSKLRDCLEHPNDPNHAPTQAVLPNTSIIYEFPDPPIVPDQKIEAFYKTNFQAEFNPILHQVILYAELWQGYPKTPGAEGESSEGDMHAWNKYFDDEILWAPNYPAMMARYEEVFKDIPKPKRIGEDESGKQKAIGPRADGADKNLAIFIANGDIDAMTPMSAADTAYSSFKYCKFKFNHPLGTHCFAAATSHDASQAFIKSTLKKDENLCEVADNDFKKALKSNQTKINEASKQEKERNDFWGTPKDWAFGVPDGASSTSLAVIVVLIVQVAASW